MFRITRKLHAIKRDLKVWSMKKFGNFRRQVDKNKGKLQFVESKLSDNPHSARLIIGTFGFLNNEKNCSFINVFGALMHTKIG